MSQKNLQVATVTLAAALVIVLAAVAISSAVRPVQAQGAVARGSDLIAITGNYSDKKQVLYVIDVGNKVLLTYAFHTVSNSSNLRTGDLELLAGRLIRWDLEAPGVSKDGLLIPDRQRGPSPERVQELVAKARVASKKKPAR